MLKLRKLAVNQVDTYLEFWTQDQAIQSRKCKEKYIVLLLGYITQADGAFP